VREIPLTQGKYAIVDDADYPSLVGLPWYAVKRGCAFYAVRPDPQKRGRQISMHRQILNPPEELEIDHTDRNGLNNQRSNIRCASRADNSHNTGGTKKSTSRFKGVFWVERLKKWRVQIMSGGTKYSLGCFELEEDAARVYDEAARNLFGEFACLNLQKV